MKVIFSILLIACATRGYAQELRSLETIKPSTDFENIHVQKISEDSLHSSFVIWVKSGVAEHFHREHTENIYVISGKAIMTLADSSFTIRQGDHIMIPKGTAHSVTEVLGRKPLKVLSIQSPMFDGTDRVLIETKQP